MLGPPRLSRDKAAASKPDMRGRKVPARDSQLKAAALLRTQGAVVGIGNDLPRPENTSRVPIHIAPQYLLIYQVFNLLFATKVISLKNKRTALEGGSEPTQRLKFEHANDLFNI
jgi:hypothetical protein